MITDLIAGILGGLIGVRLVKHKRRRRDKILLQRLLRGDRISVEAYWRVNEDKWHKGELVVGISEIWWSKNGPAQFAKFSDMMFVSKDPFNSPTDLNYVWGSKLLFNIRDGSVLEIVIGTHLAAWVSSHWDNIRK